MASVTDTQFPSGRKIVVFSNTVARTDTSAKALFVVPAGAVFSRLWITGTAASNATQANLSVGSTGGAGTNFLSAFPVTAPLGTGQSMPSSVTLLGELGTPAVEFTATYAESGTASTSGGPWTIYVEALTV